MSIVTAFKSAPPLVARVGVTASGFSQPGASTARTGSSLPGFDALGRDMHVWWLPEPELEPGSRSEQQKAWRQILSSDEVERADRFRFERHATAFVANRARLRLLLGRYLQQDAAGIAFHYNAYGKPRLENEGLEFNLTHTAGLAAVALREGGRIGIDLERSTRTTDALLLAHRYFSPTEIDALEHCDNAGELHAAFLRCWTRKEAFLKALGDGLSRPLSGFSVSCNEEPGKLLACDWDPDAPARWHLTTLDCGSEYLGAVAYEAAGHTLLQEGQLKTYTWPSGSTVL